MKIRWYARQVVLGAALLAFGCGADSCGCDGFVAQDFPDAKAPKTIPTSGTVRVTDAGLQFLSDNLPTILAGFLPGGLNFCVPPTSFSGVDVCQSGMCSTGATGCDMTMTIDDAQITPQPPNSLLVDITVGDLNESLDLEVFGADCILTLQSPADPNLPATFGAQIPVTFAVDASSPFRDVRVEIGDLVADTSNIAYDIDGRTILDFLPCEGIDLVAASGFVKDLLLGQLESQFAPILVDQVDAQLCKKCDAAACPAGTTCDADDICRYPDESCPQNPLGLSGQLQLGTILADYSEEPDAAVDLTVRAADHAVVDTGLTLGLRSGYDPVEQAICAPIDPTARDFAATPISPTVSGNTRPGGTPFHFGLGYHKKALESMLWSVWGSGATCFRVGTASFSLITTGAFGALLPSVKQLTYNRVSEAYIKIVPQKPPVVTLGANDVTPSGNSYTINDPLMTVDWKDFDVHIYGFVQDRFTRIVTIRMDLLVPIAVVADGMGGIIPVLGDFDDAITNPRILDGELVAEDPARILDLLPTLIGFALPALAGSLAQPIALPEFFGFRVNIGPGDITSVDNNTSIAIFADLEIAMSPLISRLDTAILDSSVDLSRKTPSGLVRPLVRLDVRPLVGLQSADLDVEYSYRVDGGAWSLPVRSNVLEIDNPVLVVPGAHAVEVRAQRVGEPYSADATPAKTTVVVDWESPEVDLRRHGTVMVADATDVVDHRDDLEYRWRFVTGEPGATWTEWSRSPTFDLAGTHLPERVRVEVQVRDRAGNTAADDQTVTLSQALDAPKDGPVSVGTEPKAGCNSVARSPLELWFVGLLGFGFFALRRRRRLGARVMALALLTSVGACKCDDKTGGTPTDECDPACQAGYECVENTCVATLQCSSDEDCDEGEECRVGECVPAPSCEELCDCKPGEFPSCEEGSATCECVAYCEEGCGEGEYCCHSSNSCEALPDPCADTVCDPGFGPVATSDASGASETCEVTAGTCECQELPPLPLGWHGHYASIDRNGAVTAISTYNSTYEDLMVGIVDSNLEVTWYFVDGVPATGDVEGSLNGPRGGIADKGEDIGRYTTIAVDDMQNLHVFYRDNDREVMKYARGAASANGYTFDIHDFDTDGDAGYWPSAVHLDGRVHVVWATKSVPGAMGGFETRLNHATFDASGSFDDPTATRVVVASDVARHPCGADCADRMQHCFAQTAQCLAPTNDCPEACADGSECYQGVCEIVFKEPAVGYLAAVGTNAELSRTPDGGLLLVYWDAMQDSIVWNRWNSSGGWGMPNLIGAGSGPWASGVVDGSDEVHLAWTDNTVKPPVLVYQNLTSGSPEVIQDGIRDTASGWLINDIGENVDLRIAANGDLSVVYQDATRHVLRLGTKSAQGMWQTSELGIPGNPYTGGHGFYAAMLKLPDAQFIVELTVNNQSDPTEAKPVFHE